MERSAIWLVGLLLFALTLSHAGCFLDEKLEPYYGRVVVPRAQEFHWSDGGLAANIRPGFRRRAARYGFGRAIFEGLTDYDPRTLTPVPAVATRWEPSNGGRVWTFYLRDDARWSNGELVTAADFVRSWRRTIKSESLAPHTELLANIEGSKTASPAITSTERQTGSLPSETDTSRIAKCKTERS